MSKEIRYYQREAQNAVDNALKKGIVNQLLVMATGTGKTFTAVKIIKEKGPILWITHTEELIEQSAIALLAELELMPYSDLIAVIRNAGGLLELLKDNPNGMFADDRTQAICRNIGVIKAELFQTDKPIIIASIQTLWRRLDKIPAHLFQTVVVDEAHYSGANTWFRTLNHFQPKLRLGLTATPYRMDGMLMGDVFDEIVYEYTIEKAIKDQYLCEIDAIRVKTNLNLDSVKTTAGELNQKDLEQVVNSRERNSLIVEKYKQYALGRQFIAFCVDVQHAIDLCEVFNEQGIKTNFVVGDKELTTDRKGTINQFKEGEYVGLTNCMVLTAGFDHPNVGCVIMACPTKSLTKFIQQAGRGTRLKNEDYVFKYGQNVILLDIVDSTSRHRLVNTWTLDKDKPAEERIYITEAKRQLLIDARIAREHKFKVSEQKKDVKINLLALPKVKKPMSMRMQEPATEKQLAWIERLGYDVKNVNYTKAMCFDIISAQSASEAQIWRLQKEGYDVSQGVTVAEAKLAFEQINAKKEQENINQFKQKNNIPFTDIN